ELFAKVLVEPGIEEWIVAGRRHGDGMHQKKEGALVRPLGDFDIEVSQEVEDVQRKPRNNEDDHHRYEHAVRLARPLAFLLLASGRHTARYHLGTVPQLATDLDVAKGDDDKWDDELHHTG